MQTVNDTNSKSIFTERLHLHKNLNKQLNDDDLLDGHNDFNRNASIQWQRSHIKIH